MAAPSETMPTPVESMDGRCVLLTGASGFIGSHLSASLLRSGARVHAVSRRPQPAMPMGPRWWQGDLGDFKWARSLFDAIRPEVVFHLSSTVSGSRDLAAVLPTLQDNLVSTVNILVSSQEFGCRRIVLAGSLEEPEPALEPLVPASPYAAAKMAGSAYARMFHALYETPVVIARLFMVYGPGQKDLRKLVPYVILSLLRGEAPRLSSGTRPVDWIYVDDVVDGLLTAATHPNLEGRTVELGSGRFATVREVVEELVRIVDCGIQPVFGGVADRPFEQVRIADVAATREQMGWGPQVSLEDGLRRTAEWYGRELREGRLQP